MSNNKVKLESFDVSEVRPRVKFISTKEDIPFFKDTHYEDKELECFICSGGRGSQRPLCMTCKNKFNYPNCRYPDGKIEQVGIVRSCPYYENIYNGIGLEEK